MTTGYRKKANQEGMTMQPASRRTLQAKYARLAGFIFLKKAGRGCERHDF
jgi:hypothetical protein